MWAAYVTETAGEWNTIYRGQSGAEGEGAGGYYGEVGWLVG